MANGEEWTEQVRAMPRHLVMIQVRQRIKNDLERGGGYAALARIHERFADEHQPTNGGKCSSCGDQWPCGVIAGILAPG